MNRNEIKHYLKSLDREDKIKFLECLSVDLGKSWIRVDNLSKALGISEKRAEKIFKVVDRRRGLTLLPRFLGKEEFEPLYSDHDLKSNPERVLDLLGKANIYVKSRTWGLDDEFSKMKSNFYFSKAHILWQLRDQVLEVRKEKLKDYTIFLLRLLTGHYFHQPEDGMTICPEYWHNRSVGEEKEYSRIENPKVEYTEEEHEYYKTIIEFLNYIQRRGLLDGDNDR
jgi:hypothetical protein